MSSERWDQTAAANIAMANSALGREPGTGHRSAELEKVLQLVIAQLADSDRRHTETLQLMQERLDQIGAEASAVRSQVPDSSQPAVDRITETLARLASEFGTPHGTMPFYSHPSHPPSGDDLAFGRDAARDTNAADASDPWDRQSADALADLYAELAAAPAVPAASHAGSAGNFHAQSGPVAPAEARCNSDVDRAWIDEKLNDVAARLEQSLADIRPDNAFLALGQRFDQFEDRFDTVMATLATRGDVNGLRLLEAHLTEVEGNLHHLTGQLERLDTIESQLHVLAERVDASRYDGVPSGGQAIGDVEAVASSAAEKVVQRLTTDDGADFISRHIEPMRVLLENMSSERRHGEETTTAILDTLQQAMLRVLDRVDAMETGRHQAEPFVIAAMPAPVSEPEVEDVERPDDTELYDLTRYGNPLTTPAAELEEPEEFDDFDVIATDAKPVRLLSSIDEIRRDLVADLLKAKQRANLEEFENEPTNDNEGSPPKAGIGLRFRKRETRLGSLRTKLLIGLLVVLMTGAGAAFALKRTATAMGEPARAALAKKMSALSADDAAPIADTGRTDTARNEELPDKSLPAGVVLRGFDDPAVAIADHSQENREKIPTIPHPDVAAARVVPVSLTPARDLAPTLAGGSTPGRSVAATASSSNLELPPATVGPLSLRLAAARGDPSAQFEVAARLAGGRGTDQDLKEAVRWYQKAATQGFPQAQYRLGSLYERGLGLKADIERARVWYRRAAEQGNVKAMHNLAVLSAGRGTGAPDYPTAMKWFKAAAERGLPESQFNLAVLFENGLGAERDMEKAYRWLAIAARSGDEEAIRRRDYVKSVIDPTVLAATDAAVASWNPQPADPMANDARTAGEAWKSRARSDGGSS